MLISNAYAQTAGASQASMMQFGLFAAFAVVFYLLAIRPQQKRQKELRAMIESVKTGDEVVTNGGILGRVARVTDQYLSLEVSQSGSAPVEVMVQKSAVQTVLPKGTLKAI